MKIKAVIFDADGMVINKPILFSERFSKEYNVPSEQIIPFFKNEFPKCKIGQADLKNILPKYLNAWGWEKGIDEFLRYWFESENYIDNDIIFEIDKLKEKDIRCYLATDQEKYRTDYMSDSMGLSTVFDKIFSSAYIGYEKNHFSF